jgi:metal-dependent amidase/aminoacylase/carboxypeptidase family protein
MAGVGALIALRAAMIKYDISGKVVLIGTPAEEGGVGKGILLEKGACESYFVDFVPVGHFN